VDFAMDFLGISGFHRKQMEVFTQVMGAPQFSSISRLIFPLFSHPASIGHTILRDTSIHGGVLGISQPSSTGKPRVKQMTTSFGVAGWLSEPGGPLVMTNSLRTGKIHHAINGKIHYFHGHIFNSKLLNYQRVTWIV